jgi:PAS domain S-box-containing protein
LHAETLGLGAQLAAALDAVSEPILVLDLSGQVVLLNRAFEAWLGLDAQRVLGKPAHALLAGANRPDWFAAYAQTRADSSRPIIWARRERAQRTAPASSGPASDFSRLRS